MKRAFNHKVAAIVLSASLIVLVAANIYGFSFLVGRDMAAYTTQAQKVFQQAITDWQEIRNDTLPQVKLNVVTKQWAIDTWGKGYADPDLTNILRQEKFYKGIFLIPEDASLYQANVDWAGNFGAATWGEEIYIVYENFDPWHQDAEATFIHEFTHIWEPDLGPTDSFDMDKAHTALVEGDASFMGDFYKNLTKARAQPLVVDQVPMYLITNPALQSLRLIPDAIWSLNYFPYDQGKTFVNALFSTGGWQTLNGAYNSPPSTTEQILHTDKYFADETAQPIQAPTLAEDWTQIKSDRYGEYFIQVMLSNWLPEDLAQKGAVGWAGDNFTYYERDDAYLFTWNIRWDSAADAQEFSLAFGDMVISAGAQPNLTDWFANGRYLTISLNEQDQTTLIACSPNKSAVQPTNFR